jgi:hypothetical protein
MYILVITDAFTKMARLTAINGKDGHGHSHERHDEQHVHLFFLEAFCDISHRLGGITYFGVLSDAFPGLKMWVTFACATANFLTHFIISIAVLENVPPDAGLQKRANFPH